MTITISITIDKTKCIRKFL